MGRLVYVTIGLRTQADVSKQRNVLEFLLSVMQDRVKKILFSSLLYQLLSCCLSEAHSTLRRHQTLPSCLLRSNLNANGSEI